MAFDKFTVQTELNDELRRARRWLLIVGILMFVFDMAMTWSIPAEQADRSMQKVITLIDLGILATFVALWWFAKQRPKLCLILGLVVFWGLQIFAAINDPSQLYKGILIKILFTAALIRGLKSADRVEYLRKDLEKVFE